MLTPSQNQRLSAAAQAACANEQTTRFPAEVTVAQWATESGWGSSAPGNNCFGIKLYEGAQGKQLLSTTEWLTDAELERFLSLGDGRTAVLKNPTNPPRHDGRREYSAQDCFATFRALADCFERHAQLITGGKPYAAAWAQYQASHDLPAFITQMAPVYATDPNYADKLRSILSMAQVQSALALARGNGHG
jgi:flagellum-specific peptidoglycan hydrolase FlgJ